MHADDALAAVGRCPPDNKVKCVGVPRELHRLIALQNRLGRLPRVGDRVVGKLSDALLDVVVGLSCLLRQHLLCGGEEAALLVDGDPIVVRLRFEADARLVHVHNVNRRVDNARRHRRAVLVKSAVSLAPIVVATLEHLLDFIHIDFANNSVRFARGVVQDLLPHNDFLAEKRRSGFVALHLAHVCAHLARLRLRSRGPHRRLRLPNRLERFVNRLWR